MISNARDFGAMVAHARRKLSLTQRELALAINTGERFIVELEAGKPTAQLGKAFAAAKAVGIRLEDAAVVTERLWRKLRPCLPAGQCSTHSQMRLRSVQEQSWPTSWKKVKVSLGAEGLENPPGK